MKLKTVTPILLLLFAINGSTCKKKITKYPFDMTGVWYGGDFFCGLILVIENNSTGKMFAEEGSSCLGDFNRKGKIKYKKDVLYVDKKKFDIFNEPVLVTDNDSIDAPDERDLTGSKIVRKKILAKMTLKEKGLASLRESYTFYKYVDY